MDIAVGETDQKRTGKLRGSTNSIGLDRLRCLPISAEFAWELRAYGSS